MQDETKPQRPDWESARATMGAPPLQDGTKWDKEAPSGPPVQKEVQVPRHLKKIVDFFNGIVMDESLVLDLCLDRCMELVKRNVEARMVGIDHFAGEGGGGNPYTPVNYAVVAGPLAVELYKQVLKGIEGQKEEYDRLYQEMIREREKSSPGGNRLFIPA